MSSSITETFGPVPLNAPSQRPAEPVTSGADVGPGVSSIEAGILDDQELTFRQLGKMLHSLRQIVDLPGSTREARYFVRKLGARDE